MTRLRRLIGGAAVSRRTERVGQPACGPRAPTLSVSDTSSAEGSACVFTVSLSAARTTAVSFDYATANGQATTPADYVGKSGRATIAAGQRTVTLSVNTTGELLDEDDEDFAVNLTNPSGATIADGRGQGSIQDNDAPPGWPSATPRPSKA